MLTIGVQLGMLGIGLLWFMWAAHFLLFKGHGLVALIGTVLVVQNCVGSVFNSLLFDFTSAWIYIVGIGVAGGAAFSLADRKVEA